jgi:hypothetical protein
MFANPLGQVDSLLKANGFSDDDAYSRAAEAYQALDEYLQQRQESIMEANYFGGRTPRFHFLSFLFSEQCCL